AGHISNTMNVIQEITSQTSAGTSATAGSIGKLASMAADLRESVAGFKLPDSMAAASATGQFRSLADGEDFEDLDEAVDLSMDNAVEDHFESDLSFADDDLELDDESAAARNKSEALA